MKTLGLTPTSLGSGLAQRHVWTIYLFEAHIKNQLKPFFFHGFKTQDIRRDITVLIMFMGFTPLVFMFMCSV